MELKEQLRGNFPKTIDKSKPVFSSLIANDKGTAAIQKQLNDLFKYMKEWISTPDIYEQTGVMLDKSIRFFSFLERFADETETSLKNRFAALFIRNHDTRWGTAFDIKRVFQQYFPHATIYLVENTNKIDDENPELANLIDNGDIETSEALGWSLTNCVADADARFSKGYGILFNNNGGILSQSIEVKSNQVYFLHFFLKGSIKVSVKNNSNKYWDKATNTWSDTIVYNTFTSEEWNNQSMYFITGNNDSPVIISFEYNGELTYIDYFRLFEKQPYGSFTVIAHFEGNTSVGVFGLAAGDDDPNIETQEETPPQPRYSNYGYYDKSYLFGVPVGFANDIYEDLLDYLRAQGVKAFLEIVVQDYSE